MARFKRLLDNDEKEEAFECVQNLHRKFEQKKKQMRKGAVRRRRPYAECTSDNKRKRRKTIGMEVDKILERNGMRMEELLEVIKKNNPDIAEEHLASGAQIRSFFFFFFCYEFNLKIYLFCKY